MDLIVIPKVEYDVTRNHEIVLSEENRKWADDIGEETTAWARSFARMMYGMEWNWMNF